MSYHQEFDLLAWEARKDTDSVFALWPKVFGSNVRVESTPAPTFTAYDPSGTQISTGDGVVTDLDDPLISYILITLPAAALATLGEGYSCRITWQLEGETDSYTDVRLFDVVKYPFGDPMVSLSNLREERPDVDVILDRLGQRLGFTAGDDAQERMTRVYAMKARAALESMFRTTIATQSRGGIATYTGLTRPDAQYTRARLILDRIKLVPVERFLCLREIFRGMASDPDEGTDENSALFRHYNREASSMFEALGPLKYDADENLIPETVVAPKRGAIFHRRVQG